MITVQKPRQVEVCADILNDHIRRVAPAAHRYVAVGQREPFERFRISAANDFDTGSSGMGESCRVEGVDPLQITTKLVCDLLLSLCRSVAKLRTKSRSRSGVDTQ